MGEEILVCRHRQCHHSDRLQAHLGFNLHDHLVNEALWHEALEKKPSLLYGGEHVTLIFAIKPTANWAKENPCMGHADKRKTVHL